MDTQAPSPALAQISPTKSESRGASAFKTMLTGAPSFAAIAITYGFNCAYDWPMLLGTVLLGLAFVTPLLAYVLTGHRVVNPIRLGSSGLGLVSFTTRTALGSFVRFATTNSYSFVAASVALVFLGIGTTTLVSPRTTQRILVELETPSAAFRRHIDELREKVAVPISKLTLSKRLDKFNVAGNDNSVLEFLGHKQHRLIYLVGPAGSGKSPICMQIAYSAIDSHTFDYAFYVNLRDRRMKISAAVSEGHAVEIDDLLEAHLNVKNNTTLGGIDLSTHYFRRLAIANNVLVVLDGLDELIRSDEPKPDTSAVQAVLKAADEFRRNTNATVMVVGRTEAFFHTLDEERGEGPSREVLTIDPLEQDLDWQVDQWVALRKKKDKDWENTGDNKTKAEVAKRVLKDRRLMKELAVQLQYVDDLVDSAHTIDKSTDWKAFELLYQERLKRNQSTHPDFAKNQPSHIAALEEEAYRMLLEGRHTFGSSSEAAKSAFLSGFCDMEPQSHGRWRFSPSLWREYFGVHYFVGKCEPPAPGAASASENLELSRDLVDAVKLFRADPNVMKSVSRWVDEEIAKRPEYVLTNIHLFRELVSPDQLHGKLKMKAIDSARVLEIIAGKSN